MLHRAAEVTEDVEHSRADTAAVTKNMATRVLSVGGNKAFWIYQGGIRPTVWATMLYTAEEVQMICEYAGSE